MSRSRTLWDRKGLLAEYLDDVLVWVREGAFDGIYSSGPQVIRDINPYKSMINGQMITSRSQHRTHLRDHGCIEVGNEIPKSAPKPISPNRKESLHKMLADVGDRDIKKIVKKTLRDAN